MKTILKILAGILILLLLAGGIFYFVNNEALPKGENPEKADDLANKMLKALNAEAFENTEIIEWSFRDEHFYKWYKSEDKVEVSWDKHKVILHTKSPDKNEVITVHKSANEKELIQKATDFFNNDSFWLVAPYKVLDRGTERKIVKVDEKDALLVTYTSGGSTPGDSYLWILDSTFIPKKYKMWTSNIPIGGLEATWENWQKTEAGILLSTKHKISLFGLDLEMGNATAKNPKADSLANKILKAINHENYKKTNHIEWSFGGRRSYKWDKKNHIVDVSWDTILVNLQPDHLEKSIVFYNEKQQETVDEKIVTRALNAFNNDSFWLVAPHKLYERGIIRSLVKIDDKDALKVTYTVGGSTPGDSYIWILDDSNIPKSYLMNVETMKMANFPATWEDWITTESGTLLPTNHTFGNGRSLSMGEVKGTK